MINPGYVVGVADLQSMARSALNKKTFAVNEEIRVLRVRLDTGPPGLIVSEQGRNTTPYIPQNLSNQPEPPLLPRLRAGRPRRFSGLSRPLVSGWRDVLHRRDCVQFPVRL